MNIKGLVNNLVPVDFAKKVDLRRTRNAADREPQQGGGGDAPPEQHRFTEEELSEALRVLRELPGIKENNLSFRIEHNEKRIIVFVEDPTGKVIRRIPDTELWSLLKNRQNNAGRGNLLNKAM